MTAISIASQLAVVIPYRRAEFKADINALRYGSAANMISGFEILGKLEEELDSASAQIPKFVRFLSYLKSPHPSLQKRIKNVNKHSSDAVVTQALEKEG